MTEQGVSQEDSHKTRNQLKSIGLLKTSLKKVLMKQRYLKCQTCIVNVDTITLENITLIKFTEANSLACGLFPESVTCLSTYLSRRETEKIWGY